jgi:hypothetical protein
MELVKLSKIKITTKNGPKQIHLGFTNNDGEMQVIWVSNPEHYNEPVVYYGKLPTNLNQKVTGSWHTYNVGKFGGFHGRIYVAVMKNL